MKLKKIPHTLGEAVKWKPDTHERKEAIIANYLRGTESYLIVGYFLCQSTDDWDKDGSGANSFFEWVEKELKIKRTNAQRMMLIWETVHKYLDKHGDLILQIDFAKLAMICPIVGKMDEVQALEWFHAAKENTVRNLEDNIRAHKKLPTTDNCDHINTEEWEKCKRCNKFFKRRDI